MRRLGERPMSENPQDQRPVDALRSMSEPPPKPQSPRKQRPLAPTQRNPDADAPPESRLQIVDDDDAALIPELAPERLASASRYGAARPTSRPGGTRSLYFRRTMIPILLTCGLIFAALAAMWFTSDHDHAVRRTGPWLPVALVALGAVFLLLAVINMAQVKHLMTRQRPPAAPR
jgi:hypothetical protein